MRAKTNRHGLSRYISSDVKREVRKRSGFGCVVCGNAFYTYEHIDPPFKDATEHNPNHMALLCGTCQFRSSARNLSKDSIKQASKNPKCLQEGFSFGLLDVGVEYPRVIIGSLEVIETTNIIRVFGNPVLCVDPPEQQGGPFRLSAVLTDSEGKEILYIDENEWQAPTANWDVEVTGQYIKVRRALRDIPLILKMEAPTGIVVEKLNSYYDGVKVVCQEGRPLSVEYPNKLVLETKNARLRGCKSAIDIFDDVYIGCDCKEATMSELRIDNLEN